MKPTHGGRCQRWWTAGTALALALPGLWLALGDGVYVGNGTDLYSYQLPMRRMLRALLLDGQLPQWNPYILGGVPLHAGMQLGIAYPPNWLCILVAPEQAVGWLIAAHLFVLCLGGAMLANAHAGRALWSWRPGVAVTAALLAGSGPTWGHIWPGHISFVQAWSWTPAIAALILVACKRLDRKAALWASAALAMQLLAGHPQVTYMTGAAVVALVAAHLLEAGQAPGGGQRRLKAVGLLVLILAAGALLAAVQLLPTWALRPLLNRELGGSQPLALSFSAPPRSLLTALAPDAFGGPGQRLGSFSYHETVAHFGAAGLALMTLACARWSARTWALGLAILGMVLLSPGRHGFLMEALLPVVPGLGAFRVPSRWLLPAVLLAAVLAGQATDALIGPRPPPGRNLRRAKQLPRPRQPWAALLLWLLAAGIGVAAASCEPDGGWWPPLLDARRSAGADLILACGRVRWALWAGVAAFAAAGLGAWRPGLGRPIGKLLAAAVIVEAVAFGLGHAGESWHRPAPDVDWSKATATWMRGSVSDQRLATAARLRHANWGGAHDVRVAGGYETAVPAWSNRYANHLAGRSVERYAVNLQVRRPSAWLDRLAVTHLLRHPRDGAAARAFQAWPQVKRTPEGWVVHQHPRPQPRVSMVAKVLVLPDRRAALNRLARLPRETVILDRQPKHALGAGTARILDESNDEVRVEVTAQAAGVLLVRDVLLQGWSVYVDGVRAEPLLADALFRAVEVPAGRHEVVWQYRAPGLLAGTLLTLLFTLLLLVGLLMAYRREAREAPELQADRAP